jgi:putative tricarboxylic transport membrane protein
MDAIEALFHGFGDLMAAEMLLTVLLGAIAGTLVGVLPGLGPVAGAAIVLPITFTMPPIQALIMITGIYVGSMYGGSTTAVLLNMPGEAASVVTTIDGYERTKQGKAGSTLAIMAVGSFVAGTIGVILVMFLAPVLSEVSLALGPAEFFALTVGGLIILGSVSSVTALSGLFPMVFGVLAGTVGMDYMSSAYRFTFGVPSLSLGIDLVPVAIGLFGISQVLLILEERSTIARPRTVKLRELLPTREEWKRSVPSWARGGVIGSGFGLLPGPSATLASFAAYRVEKAVSKHRKEVGSGAVEGVASPEAANNAAAVTGLVPALSLGLPFSATYALMLSALTVHGIQPGPLFITQNPDMFWTLVAALYVSGIILLILNLPMVSVWVSILRTPRDVLFPAMIVVASIGAYSIHLNTLDLYLLLAASCVGYLFYKLDFSAASFIIGLVLGPLVEKYGREALWLEQGDLTTFVSGWFSIAVWVLVIATLLAKPLMKRWRGKPVEVLAGVGSDDSRG